MARLQILPLPEGAGDDRPPFVLVIDQVTEEEAARLTGEVEAMDGFAVKAGARAVAVFHGMTMNIPANEPLPMPEVDDAEHAGTAQIVYAHERTRLDLCNALLVSGDTTWRRLIEAVAERQREVARVLNLPERPEVMAVNPEQPSAFMDGYAAGIRAAKHATLKVRPETAEYGG